MELRTKNLKTKLLDMHKIYREYLSRPPLIVQVSIRAVADFDRVIGRLHKVDRRETDPSPNPLAALNNFSLLSASDEKRES